MDLKRLDLNKLYTFFEIAEHGGVAGAARHLGRTPSAVSQSLSSLEGALELRLFDRVGRRLVLTRDGQLLRSRFGEYQRVLQQTVDQIRNEDGEVRGLVRVGLFPGFPSTRLAEIVTSFTSNHPGARVRVVYDTQQALTEQLLANRLDSIVTFEPRSVASPRIRSTRLFEQELVLVAGRKFFRDGFDARELRNTAVIDYYRSNPLIGRWLEHHLGEIPEDITIRVWAATTDLVLELVRQQAGVGVVPRYLAEPLIRRRQIRIVETSRQELRDTAWLNELGESNRAPALAAFREAVLEEFSGEPPQPEA
ncbi:MAG: LysR family transcriptional regulator [Myxococcales bacterium]|nr:LysR family transcriptional regulator [Myxococcales bacterium]